MVIFVEVDGWRDIEGEREEPIYVIEGWGLFGCVLKLGTSDLSWGVGKQELSIWISTDSRKRMETEGNFWTVRAQVVYFSCSWVSQMRVHWD